MQKQEYENRAINKLIEVEDKLSEIGKIVKIINIWAQEYDYELMPILKLLNNKMAEINNVIKEKLQTD